MSYCKNCGAPEEPVRCSYCLTPTPGWPTYRGKPVPVEKLEEWFQNYTVIHRFAFSAVRPELQGRLGWD